MSDWIAKIEAELAHGNMAAAAALASQALATGERTTWLLNIVAWRHEQAGEFSAARELLDEAMLIDPHDPLIQISLGAVLRAEGRMDEAVAQLTRAIPIAGHIGALWLERAYAFEASGDLKAAEADFRMAVNIEPSAPGFGGLAGVLARQNRLADARPAARQALAFDPVNVAASIALARCDVAEGQAASAVAALEGLSKRTDIHRNDRLTATCLLGDAHHRAANHDAAFSAYALAKQNFVRDFDAPEPEDGQRAYVENLAQTFDDIGGDAFRAVGNTKASPVFLIGFPRSGTTLVENILASISGVFAIEERPTFRAVDQAFLRSPDGLRDFARLSEDDLGRYREAYWEQAKRFGLPDDVQMLIDMDPLKGIKLPVIARLFPGAKIVVMRRDPRDVVWSCFKTPFAPSAAAFEFTSIERAALHYAAVMQLQEACLAQLSVSVHLLGYEALVADFDATTAALCTFFGLRWTPELRQFARTAQRRGVATASAGQVERGLFDGRGQWRNYARYIEPALPILAPWIDAFGYAAEDQRAGRISE